MRKLVSAQIDGQKLEVACFWGSNGLPLSTIRKGLANYQVTAVLTATSSTVLHSNITQRTPHTHVAGSD